MPSVGEVWKHLNFYTDGETGELLPKYLLVLSVRANGDVVYRLLTSREYNRVRDPACYHDGDRPGYFLGIPQPNGSLNLPTWLDLREIEDDYDARDFASAIQRADLVPVCTIAHGILCPALHCAAYAQDTTRSQKDQIMLSRQALNCS